MASHAAELSRAHQAVVARFVDRCRADERVVAATLYGSNARGAADEHSDLDLGLITADDAFERFVAEREDFIRTVGEPLLLETFDLATALFYIFADGTEGELSIGRESHFTHIHDRPHKVLLDKKNILAGADFSPPHPTQAEQSETLRRLIYWFWHDFSHFTTALARGQLWWAHGQLEVLRLLCVNLARLRHNFDDPHVAGADYFKVDLTLPAEQLSPLEETYCPLESGAMLRAVHVILRFYREAAVPLAQSHGIPYPAALDRLMVERLEKPGHTSLS